MPVQSGPEGELVCDVERVDGRQCLEIQHLRREGSCPVWKREGKHIERIVDAPSSIPEHIEQGRIK